MLDYIPGFQVEFQAGLSRYITSEELSHLPFEIGLNLSAKRSAKCVYKVAQERAHDMNGLKLNVTERKKERKTSKKGEFPFAVHCNCIFTILFFQAASKEKDNHHFQKHIDGHA